MIAVTPTTWRGLPAWLLTGDALEAVITEIGASLACIRRRSEALNPLWQPHWPAARHADPMVHGDPRGEASLLCLAVGSLLCLDRFGPPRVGEDRPFHGEAAAATWNLARSTADAVTFAVSLPNAGLALERTVSFIADTCVLDTSALALGHDRDVEWCEHLTLGDPFADGMQVTAGIDRVDPMPGITTQPERHADDATLIADALAMPVAGAPPRGDVWSGRVTPGTGWWRAEHPGLGRRLTARWQADDFPWLVIWTQHCERQSLPWNGRERARGLELSTKPFPSDHAYPETTRLSRPARCLLPAGARVTRRVTLTWEAIESPAETP